MLTYTLTITLTCNIYTLILININICILILTLIKLINNINGTVSYRASINETRQKSRPYCFDINADNKTIEILYSNYTLLFLYLQKSN